MSTEEGVILLEKTLKTSRFRDRVAHLVREGVPELKAREMIASEETCGRLRRDLIKVKQELDEAKRQALTDSLTGLFNRRGFEEQGKKQLEIADRAKKRMWLLFVDVDNLKQINTLGHAQGDQALIDTAQVIEKTFRKSDVIARIGGDEFVILAFETDQYTENKEDDPVKIMTGRLQDNIEVFNETSDRRYRLSLSIGAELRSPGDNRPLDQLLLPADEAMFLTKEDKPK